MTSTAIEEMAREQAKKGLENYRVEVDGACAGFVFGWHYISGLQQTSI